jgi:tRNA (mo5U34)-methyltransferase
MARARSPPPHARRDVFEHCLDLVRVVDAELVGHGQRQRVGLGDGGMGSTHRRLTEILAFSRGTPQRRAGLKMPDTIESIRWFHSIDLGSRVTRGVKGNSLLRAEADTMFSIPVAGKTVLDIGAWDGFFSFEAERRGAARVLATDWFCWEGPGIGTKDGFNFARSEIKSRVEDKSIDPTDITPEAVGTFDVVILSGVIYHVRDPISVIERAAKVTSGHIVIETALGALHTHEPTMSLLHVDPKNKDLTNWWAPNPACVMQMLKIAGFKSSMFAEHPTNPLNHPSNPRGYFLGFK